jgi:hypothetical protein
MKPSYHHTMKKLLAAYVIVVIVNIALSLGLLAGAVWVVVKVLKHIQVIPL